MRRRRNVALVFALLGLVAPGQALAQKCTEPSFAPRTDYGLSTGLSPRAIVVGDFNRDGKADFATANFGTNDVAVRLGNGSGGFGPVITPLPNAGQAPWALASADLNEDGKLDLAVANLVFPGSTVTILLGNGSGGFTAAVPPSVPVDNSPQSIAVADFNRDGHPDLAVANTGSDTVSIRLGNGDGTFFPPVPSFITVGSNPYEVVAGDFNRDGKADFAALVDGAGVDYARVLYGNGDGTFGSPADSLLPGPSVDYLVTADFNRDDRPDLAVANNDFGGGAFSVYVILGNAAGAFDPPIGPFPVGAYAQMLALGDFNGDGNADLAVPNSSAFASTTVTVLLGKGDGSFGAPKPFATDVGPDAAAAGDFNGDGRLDLAVANAIPNDVSVLLNDFGIPCANSSFGPAARVFEAGGSIPVSLARGELNGDGLPDLVVTNFASPPNNVSILRGSGFGDFQSPAYATAGSFPRHTAIGDFNGDGRPDLAVANGDGTVSIVLANLVGGFNPPANITLGGSPVFVEVADLNADGKLDLAVADNVGRVAILLGNGSGGFASQPDVNLPGSSPSAVTSGDFNEDGRLDLTVSDSNLSRCWILLGNGSGAFPTLTSFVVDSMPTVVVAADFNRDGHLDVATANAGAGNVSILRGDGTGGFVAFPSSPVSVGLNPQGLTAGDFDGNGFVDLATANSGGSVSILLGDGAGGFSPQPNVTVAGAPVSVVPGDFDGDGRVDLATLANGSQSVVLLHGNGAGAFSVAPQFSAGASSPRLVSIGDFDRDGKTDLAVPNGPEVRILLGDGLGGFSLGSSASAASSAQQAAVGDFDRDGIPDLAVAELLSGNLTILKGTGSGTFTVLRTITSVGSLPRSVATADFDHDGKLDLAVGNFGGTIRILLGDGTGDFTPPGPPLAAAGSAVFVVAADLDNNGDPDLAVGYDGGNVSVFMGQPGAFFNPLAPFASGSTKLISLAVDDFDLDGKPDLAVASQGPTERVAIFSGNGDGTFSGRPPVAAVEPQSVVTGDFNGDGKPDLAVAHGNANVSIHLGNRDLTFGAPRAFAVASNPFSMVAGDFNRDGKLDLAAAHGVVLGAGVSVLLNTNCRARRLAFFNDVSSCDSPGAPFSSQPIVYVLDDGANLMQCDTGNNVDASLLGGPGTLGGTTTKPTNAGVALYDNLFVTLAGRGYRLGFDYPGVGRALSRSFSQGLTVAISGPAEFCATAPPTLYTAPRGYDRYDWGLDGTPVSVTPRVFLSGLSPGPHTLNVAVLQDGCSALDTRPLTVNADLSSVTISVAAPTTVCQATGCFGGTATETHVGGGAVTYQWGFRTVPGPTEPVTDIPGQTNSTYILSGPDFPGPGAYSLILKVKPTCGTTLVSNEVPITVDNSAPQDSVRFFTVTSRFKENKLEWLNPPGYSRVLIRYNSGPTCTFPPTETSGTFLADQPGPLGGRDSFPHAGINNDENYCYTIFVDKGGAGTGPYSAGRSNRGRPFDSACLTCYVKWAYSVGTTSLAPPGIGVDRIHAAANDNALHSMLKGASGGTWPLLWKPVPMNGPSQGRPSTVPISLGGASRVVFLGSQDKHVYAIDADTGAFVSPWSPIPDLGAMVQAAPSGMFTAFGGAYNYILVGTRDSAGDNKFFVLKVSDGSTVYTVNGSGTPDWGRIGIIAGQAAVDYLSRRVYFTSYARGLAPNDNTVWCVNLDDGKVIWARPYGDIAAGPTLSGDKTKLYIGTNAGAVEALRALDGALLWAYATGDGPVKSFVSIDRLSPNNDLYFSTTNTVWSVADSGATPPTLRWSRLLNNPSTPVFLAGGTYVYVGAGNGRLYRLDSTNGFDAPGAALTFPLVLGDGSGAVGSPTIDPRGGFLYVGTDAGIVYAVQLIP